MKRIKVGNIEVRMPSAAEVKRLISEHQRTMASRGGKARAKSLTAKQRQEIARMGGKAKARRHDTSSGDVVGSSIEYDR
jgi:general stress protein YciG